MSIDSSSTDWRWRGRHRTFTYSTPQNVYVQYLRPTAHLIFSRHFLLHSHSLSALCWFDRKRHTPLPLSSNTRAPQEWTSTRRRPLPLWALKATA